MITEETEELLKNDDISDPIFFERYMSVMQRSSMGGSTLDMRVIYGYDGSYVGLDDSNYLLELITKEQITPQKIAPDKIVASIGWSDKRKMWFGWSHRMYEMFGIGSIVNRKNIAYVPVDKHDFLEQTRKFWADEWEEPPSKLNVTAKHSYTTYTSPSKSGELTKKRLYGVTVSWVYSNTITNNDLRGKINSQFTPYPDQWGRGEWVAKTLDDAKQMAIDFATAVS